jgi:hypothetical protein
MPPFMDEVATSLANKKPPPKIQDYAASALEKWVEKFVAEKRAARLPHRKASTTCGACGSKVDVYRDGTRKEFFSWCAKCLDKRTWSCSLCGSEMKVEKVGERGYGPICTGCGRTLVFDEPAPVHVPESWEGERLWELLLRSVGTLRWSQAWRFVKRAESIPWIFDNPDALHLLISPLFSGGGADRVVSKFFEFEYTNPAELARRKREREAQEEDKMWDTMFKLALLRMSY